MGINMEEMIILNREILSHTTLIQTFVLMMLWLVVFLNMCVTIEKYAHDTYKIILVCLMVFVANMITIDIVKNDRLGKQVERIEVIGYFEDFQKKIESRGYEVVERRGDIVVLEREYEQ
ncbi:hypothetical protein FE326_06900 [Dolosigranulum pigrum]|uniref:hypothetical protein n=1 Tax=Dolosigranulum pigrum TaxID=29394 RepID=UPI001AD87AAA|nr:hypothetical protein [Dolosigranulum pigrum]QTJ41909.1 hypothetical protein FE326_06900 [Dolosigranulum pigrum]